MLGIEKTFQWDKRLQEGEIDRTEVFTNIGLNTGHVIIGNIGPDKRLTLTVMGGNVDLASRLLEQNRNYGTDILATDSIYMAVQDKEFVLRELDIIAVKGTLKRKHLYELVCRLSDLTPELETRLNRFAEGYGLFLQRKWAEAQRVL